MNLAAESRDKEKVVITAVNPEVDAERALLRQARNGDADAYCDLARSYEERLFRQASTLAQRETLAEELVVETLVEAWRSLGRFDGSCRFSTWLYAILLHRFQKATRRSRWRPFRGSELSSVDAVEAGSRMARLADDGASPTERLCRSEMTMWLLAAIRELPAGHQSVLLLRFFEDASLSEIASALGVSVGTVKSRLHYGLARLRECPKVMNLVREWRES